MGLKMAAKFSILFIGFGLLTAASGTALAAGGIQIVPYASVSSTKAIKPNQVGKKTSSTEATEESVAQRTTYGLRLSMKLSRLFHLQVQGGTNKLDQTL